MTQDPNDSSQGFPFFDQIAKAMASSGPVQWDMARQFAMMTATNSDLESNVEPTARIAVNQLVSVADLHVRDVTGLSTSESTTAPKIDVVTRSIWVHHTLDAFKFYFSAFSNPASSNSASEELVNPDDPTSAMMSNLTK